MEIDHDSKMGGHLGIKKTQNRIAAVFYWPRMQSDVKKFCRSCDKCQRTVQKGRLPFAPLGKMPIIEQTFKRVAIDIIGPLTPNLKMDTNISSQKLTMLLDTLRPYP